MFFFQDGGRGHPDIPKMLFLTPDDTNIAHIYQHIKFDAYWSIIRRDMPFCVFSKMAAAAVLIFRKSDIFDP